MKTYWVAEIGSNHNQDINRTIKLIQEAEKIGADAVKFQLFKADKLFHSSFKNKINDFKKCELPESFLPEIEGCCNDLDIEFGMSVFDLEAVDIAKDYVDWLKIGSFENEWIDLIKAVSNIDKPWMLSCGMINYIEMIKATAEIEILPKVLFHCNSNYPAHPKNCRLNRIRQMYIWNISPSVGWSDHTVNPGVIYKAIECGASHIEFHFDLESSAGYESRHGHCWKPSWIKEVIDNVKCGEIAAQNHGTDESESKMWKTDPSDGLRPLKKYREKLKNQ